MSYEVQRFMLVRVTPAGGILITSWKEHLKDRPRETYPQTLTTRLPKDLRRRLDLVSAALNVSHSQVMRYLLEKYLMDLN